MSAAEYRAIAQGRTRTRDARTRATSSVTAPNSAARRGGPFLCVTAGLVEVEIPLRIQSVLNLHETPYVRASRVKGERRAVVSYLTSTVASREALSGMVPPYVVTLIRIAPRPIRDEHENLRAGFKGCVDAIAGVLGVDDGDASLVTWVYWPQEKAKSYAVRVRIETRGRE